jgi:hypothetical protein
MSFETKGHLEDTDWQFVPRLSPEHVWDAFVIYSLLDDRKRLAGQLKVPHTGDQAERFRQAMEGRNHYIIENGQPDALLHACDKCLRIYETDADLIREY